MNYYNENDPFAAAWLRELIKAGLISNGEVDERSIVDVKPTDLAGFRQCHLFAGIGGWSYALRLADWPDEKEVWSGSCPCQPLSCSGQRKGHADERHLWPAFYNLIAECKPSVIFGEQVSGPDGREWLSGVRADLEGAGYALGCADLCAAGVGAPQIRQRLYWVANADANGSLDGIDAENRWPASSVTKCGGTGGLANADGGKSSNGRIQSGGKYRQQSKNSGTNGMANPKVAERGSLREEYTGRGIEEAGGSGSIGGLGDTNSEGPQGRGERLVECPYQWPVGTPNLAVLCTDGKARRFKPGAFPLATGVSARVGKLRGAGNSIVPQVAKEFIKAFTEIK